MFSKLPNQSFKMLVRNIVIFLGIIFSQWSLGLSNIQEQYLAEEPLTKIANRLYNQGMTEQEICEYFKQNLPKVTPKLAKEKFGIDWIENSLKNQSGVPIEGRKIVDQGYYPTVAICNMGLGAKVGYGLFAMEKIAKGQVIAEYTGRLMTDDNYKPGPYAVKLGDKTYLTAASAGNVARFALHLMSEQELEAYQYKYPLTSSLWFEIERLIPWRITNKRNEIATANAALVPLVSNDATEHVLLVALKDIESFEQIGFSYDTSFGFEDSPWPDEPIIFNKEGEPIVKNEYKILNRKIRLTDPLDKKAMYILLRPGDYWSNAKRFELVNIIYVLIFSEDVATHKKHCFITDTKVYEKQVYKPRNRITVPGYILEIKNNDLLESLKFMTVIWTIETAEGEHNNQDKLEKRAILSAAREGNYEKVYELLGTKASGCKNLIRQLEDGLAEPKDRQEL